MKYSSLFLSFRSQLAVCGEIKRCWYLPNTVHYGSFFPLPTAVYHARYISFLVICPKKIIICFNSGSPQPMIIIGTGISVVSSCSRKSNRHVTDFTTIFQAVVHQVMVVLKQIRLPRWQFLPDNSRKM